MIPSIQGRSRYRPWSLPKAAQMSFLIGIILALATFLIAASPGFTKNLWLVIAALAGRVVFDVRHWRLINDPNLPLWLALLYIGFDVVRGAWRGKRGSVVSLPVLAAEPG